jgi:hypothetical protein
MPTPRARSQHARNEPRPIAQLVRQLVALDPERIVVESTGGYERTLVTKLAEAGLPVVIVNPRRVRSFGQAMGILAKTDVIDARLLALFSEKAEPEQIGISGCVLAQGSGMDVMSSTHGEPHGPTAGRRPPSTTPATAPSSSPAPSATRPASSTTPTATARAPSTRRVRSRPGATTPRTAWSRRATRSAASRARSTTARDASPR